MYLEREGFIAPTPGQQGEWAFVTKRGQAVAEAENFEAYRIAANRCPHLSGPAPLPPPQPLPPQRPRCTPPTNLPDTLPD